MVNLNSIVLMIKSIFLAFFGKISKLNGDLIADKLTEELGSWRFIKIQFFVWLGWISMNTYFASKGMYAWDSYPFVMLSLLLTLQSALIGPIVLMSQNKQAKWDRKAVMTDLLCDLRSEQDIKLIKELLSEIDKKM